MTYQAQNLPFYFQASRDVADQFLPNAHAKSPWDPQALAGGPVSALLASFAQAKGPDGQAFHVARFTVDILGKVPNAPLSLSSELLRDGRQTKFQRILMFANNSLVAQAMLVWARHLETPAFPNERSYAPPEEAATGSMPGHSGMGGAIQVRRERGHPQMPGASCSWLRMDGQVIEGQAATPFAKAALFADFGNGFGAATHPDEWSFANLDITLQLMRMPVGDWLLLDAATHGAGNGHATARNIFADKMGVFARGFQTIFVAPGHESKMRPKQAS